MKAQHCDQCRHFRYEEDMFALSTKNDPPPKAYCTLKYNIRFYAPKSPLDDNWGWKRRCLSFKEKE
jgi:hypothetical protein